MATKYLYGAAVQGIQGFIFETNKLREIIGASEYIQQVCTSMFAKVADINVDELDLHSGMIQGAAGNIRFLFDNREICAKVVKEFPYEILKEAPGLQLSQAVVEVVGELEINHISQLIQKLDEQRNKPQMTFLGDLMIVKRNRQTYQAAVWSMDNEEHLSAQQILKRKWNEGNSLKKKMDAQKHKWTMGDHEQIVINPTNEKRDEWIAIIHADGNNLGRLIMQVNSKLAGTKNLVQSFFHSFSAALDKATTNAARIAYRTVFDKEIEKGELVPFRPVILGGDDLTVVIKARHAVQFTKMFLYHFEQETKKYISPLLAEFEGLEPFQQGLTSCAGVAYIKPNYPFHYGYEVAEMLCGEAKTISKDICAERSPSALMLHSVHSSFVESWKDTVERELKCSTGSFCNGPYFLNPTSEYNTIDELQHWKELLLNQDAPKSQLRKLITEYIENPASAQQYERRIFQNEKKSKRTYLARLGMKESLFVKKNRGQISPALDIIKLATIENENA